MTRTRAEAFRLKSGVMWGQSLFIFRCNKNLQVSKVNQINGSCQKEISSWESTAAIQMEFPIEFTMMENLDHFAHIISSSSAVGHKVIFTTCQRFSHHFLKVQLRRTSRRTDGSFTSVGVFFHSSFQRPKLEEDNPTIIRVDRQARPFSLLNKSAKQSWSCKVSMT